MICKCFACSLTCLLLAALLDGGARAAGGATLTGSVVDGFGRTVSGVQITLEGAGLRLRREGDVHGAFVFTGLPPGSYRLTARSKDREGFVIVDLAASGASVTIELLTTVGRVAANVSRPPVKGSGTDVTLNQTMLDRMPYQGSLPQTLLQLPAAARGANGVVHINGDHGDINYYVDGVAVPQELNREVGSEIDPSDIAFMDVVEGAFPAQYGGRFAAVINVNTRIGNGSAGASGYAQAGSYAAYTSYVNVHAPAGSGQLSLALAASQGDRFLDPPNFTAVHDDGSQTNAFLRYAVPFGNDYANVTLIHSYQSFQIPNDVAGGEPAVTDDNETQSDSFLAAQVHHALASGGAFSYGLGYKQSRIRDFGDAPNDFTYGYNLNVAAGGSADDCSNGRVAACAYSLNADRAARDLIVNFDDLLDDRKHTIRYGASYDVTLVDKNYAVTLQPHNFLAPVLTPEHPDAAIAVVDDTPNAGHTSSAYLQDSWAMSPIWLLDAGIRQDFFTIFSTQFQEGFAQTSPRIKLTRLWGNRASAYAYFGRFFTPFSLENVSPSAAHLLNLPDQPSPVTFDLRPQRDSVFEIGGHLPVGRGDLGARLMQKDAVDLIDDTQVGVTALHQDINYAAGNVSVQSAYFQMPLTAGGRAYISLTHVRSVNAGCETQLLAPCFGAPAGWTPADHDQNWDATGGMLANDRRGGWLAIDAEYGSGLSSDYCMPASFSCKVPPHTTFDFVKGIGLRGGTALTLSVYNVLNDRYRITYQNAQGDHYASGRTFEVGWRFATPQR
ncbi:MAG: TonB-dependent receptor [Candidatus Tumulicola sp.]